MVVCMPYKFIWMCLNTSIKLNLIFYSNTGLQMDLPSWSYGTGHRLLDIKGWSNASAQSFAHSTIYSYFRSGRSLFSTFFESKYYIHSKFKTSNYFQAIYPFLTWLKLIRKPLHKMIWGGILAACAFIISGIVELHLLVIL